VYSDLEAEAAETVAEIWGRFQSSMVDYPDLLQRQAEEHEEDWDHVVPFHDRHGGIAFWAHEDDLADLFDSLFPHDLKEATVQQVINASIVIQLHASLECYAKALGIEIATGLPNAIRTWLSAAGVAVSSDIFDDLVDCDATRNILVHNRGIVDDRYLRKVRDPVYSLDELRLIDQSVIQRFAFIVRHVGGALHAIDGRQSAT
jgi:hypothetical protein